MNLPRLASSVVERLRRLQDKPIEPRSLRPEMCRLTPSNQAIADIMRGTWHSEFPSEYGVHTGGQVRHFDFDVDDRVKWVDSVIAGGLKGRAILELGPYEAYNTWQMEKLGAERVVAVESNNIAFLKCLLVKEVTGLRARFLYGDFIRYLQSCQDFYDIVWASGVIYHQTQPLELIQAMSKVTSNVFVSTHYYHDSMKSNPDSARYLRPERDVVVELDGLRVPCHYRSYLVANGALFAGGSEEFSYWVAKEDLFELFRRSGFTKIDVQADDLDSTFGPTIKFLARKPQASR